MMIRKIILENSMSSQLEQFFWEERRETGGVQMMLRLKDEDDERWTKDAFQKFFISKSPGIPFVWSSFSHFVSHVSPFYSHIIICFTHHLRLS